MSAHLRAGPFRALKMRPVRQEAVHSLWSRLFCGPLKMRRVPEEAVFCTARIFRTVEACFWYRVLSQRHFSRPHIFFWGGVKIVYLHQLQFKLNNTNMRNNYITPTCEEIEINLDNTVLQSSILPSGFEDGGEIW